MYVCIYCNYSVIPAIIIHSHSPLSPLPPPPPPPQKLQSLDYSPCHMPYSPPHSVSENMYLIKNSFSYIFLPHHIPRPTPTASRTFSTGNIITVLAPIPSSHFRNARLMPSGAGTGTMFKSFGPPDPDRKTTVHGGTKGRSSREAPRMAYSCANRREAWRRV